MREDDGYGTFFTGPREGGAEVIARRSRSPCGAALDESGGKRGVARGDRKVWIAEAERRFQELRDGVVQGIPARDVFAEMRTKRS